MPTLRNLTLAVLLFAPLACGPTTREVVLTVSPGTPSPEGCALGAERCHGGELQVCSSSGRWWTSARCSAGCVTEAEGPRCAREGEVPR